MACNSVYVVFGAAVRSDGTPSGTLRRRTERAFVAAAGDPGAYILVSGGLGRFPPPEHEVMASILRAGGFEEARIIHDGASMDTLDTVVNSIRLIRALDRSAIPIVCTSSYHTPRCWLLFRLFGMPTGVLWLKGDLSALGPMKFLYYCIRECAALPYDAFLVLFRHRFGRNRDPNEPSVE